uniref:Uncharacterized protein n=1 Tax=Romanomermis culicivorax TaxID=13658 RepID=A0A915IIZ8_ROMCU
MKPQLLFVILLIIVHQLAVIAKPCEAESSSSSAAESSFFNKSAIVSGLDRPVTPLKTSSSRSFSSSNA